MRAWLLNAYDGVDTMRLAGVPDPKPAAGEVVLRTLFAGLNPADAFLALNQYPAKPKFPHVLGRDGVEMCIRDSSRAPDVVRPAVWRSFTLQRRSVVRKQAYES